MEEFESLYNKVDEIKRLTTEKKKLEAERHELEAKTKQLADSAINKYQEAETEAENKIIKAEKMHEEHKAELRKLTKAKAEAEAKGEAFQDGERMKELKGEIVSHEITVEVMEDMKQEIVLDSADLQQLHQYQAEALDIIKHIAYIENKMLEALTEVRGAEVMRCLATLEQIPGRNTFLPGVFETIETMRKGEAEE